MRLATTNRYLSSAEKTLASDVFRRSLPSWDQIVITDGLGPIPGYDNPYTANPMGIGYALNLGPAVYPDATLSASYSGFGQYRDIFIHEMTHVWQYHMGYWVEVRSLWANTGGAGYSYTVGAAWDDYNVEQQAQLVEDWFAGGMSSTDDRFVYIDKILRKGTRFSSLVDVFASRLSADELRKI